MIMNRWKGKVAIVTGTSSGIGDEIAKQLVDHGLKVVGLGRRKERGEELAKVCERGKGKFYPRTVDISNEDQVLETFKWIKEHLGPVHILINNAGIKADTNLVEGDTTMWKSTLNTNVLGLCIMTREAVKIMRENNVDGHIVHVNSLSGHRIAPVADLNVYPASKYAVTALTETLRQELNALDLKIKISSVSPGAVWTEMINPGSGVTGVYNFLKPEDVADIVIYVLSTPPHVQIHDVLVRPVGQAS